MNFNDIVNTRLDNKLDFCSFNEELLKCNLEFSSEDDIDVLKSKDESFIINLDTELKTRIKEDGNIINNIRNNGFKITNFNFFFIYNHHQLENLDEINEVKNKSNGKFNKVKTKLGRKRKRDITSSNEDKKENEKRTHNKYSDDNIRKKCKNIILKYAFRFINAKIKEIYKGKLGYGRLKKQLRILKHEDKIKSSVEVDKTFLEKSLKDIFSENISNRVSGISPNHNKEIIKSLINDKDKEKNKYFNSLFNLTFLNCLNFFIEKEYFKELDGFTRFSSIKESILKKQGKAYVELLEYYLNNFKEIINKKKARKKIKKEKISDAQ